MALSVKLLSGIDASVSRCNLTRSGWLLIDRLPIIRFHIMVCVLNFTALVGLQGTTSNNEHSSLLSAIYYVLSLADPLRRTPPPISQINGFGTGLYRLSRGNTAKTKAIL
jgi:hypothetical protein